MKGDPPIRRAIPAVALVAALLGACSEGGGGELPAAFADFTTSGPGNAASGLVSDEHASPAGEAQTDGRPVAARALGALERLGAHALVGLARKLETGAPLDELERACLGAHDRSLGEPLAALACDAPLPVADTAVALRSVRLVADDACLAALGDAARAPADVVAGCDWAAGSAVLATGWVASSEPVGNSHAGGARPLRGAVLDYAAEPPTLTARHLESPPDGEFDCAADPIAGTVTGETSVEPDCRALVADLARRLERFADALEPSMPN